VCVFEFPFFEFLHIALFLLREREDEPRFIIEKKCRAILLKHTRISREVELLTSSVNALESKSPWVIRSTRSTRTSRTAGATSEGEA